MIPVNSILILAVSLALFFFVPIEYSLIFLATLLLFWNYQSNKTFLNWFFLFFFILIYTFPAAIRYLDLVTVQYTVYYDLNPITGIYIFIYTFLLVFTKKVFEKSLSPNFGTKINRLFLLSNRYESRTNANFLLLIAYISYFLIIYYIDSVGWYRTGNMALMRDAATKPPQQIAILVEFGPILLILTSMLLSEKKQPLTLLIYAMGFMSLFAISLLSGSRWLVVSYLIVLFFNHEFLRKHTLLLFVIGTPFIGLLFPTLLVYRSSDNGLYDSLIQVLDTDFEAVGALITVISDRMNMLSTTNLIVNDFGGVGGGANYFGNIVSLVPRLLWPGKPIQFNSNDLGADLGIINEQDYLTSVSLTVIGESFYEIAFFGLIIALIQGVIYALVDSMDKKSKVSNIVYFLLSMKVVTLGTMYSFTAEIINFFVVGVIVVSAFVLMIYKSDNEKSTNSN